VAPLRCNRDVGSNGPWFCGTTGRTQQDPTVAVEALGENPSKSIPKLVRIEDFPMILIDFDDF